MRTTIADFLVSRIAQIDCEHVFGVPGDFNLQLMDQIQRCSKIDFIGCCNELNAAYAADGYARLNGISVLLTTYGVGDLGAISGVAGAAAEQVPLVCISGAPPLHIMQQGTPLHHTLGDGNYNNVMNCFSQVCSDYACLTPDNAAFEIDRLLTNCYHNKKPVYIQIPSDISHITIDAESSHLELGNESNAEQLSSAISALTCLWQDSHKPAILADMHAERLGYDKLLLDFAEATSTSYATLTTGKAVLPEQHPLFIGVYQGSYSAPESRDLIEESDFLITTSPRLIEANSGHFTDRLPNESIINLQTNAISIRGVTYYAVNPCELLTHFLESVQEDAKTNQKQYSPNQEIQTPPIPEHACLTQTRLWPRIAHFIAPNDVVIAESGTSSLGLGGQKLPSGVTYINSNIWGAIGFTLPAVLGTCLAAPKRRHLLFIGDGSFQLTMQELSTLLHQDQKPIIFIINNFGYTIERFIHGINASYNDIKNWDYSALPSIFSSSDQYISFRVQTEGQLEQAITTIKSSNKLSLVELQLDALDAPESLKKFGSATAEFDYGHNIPNQYTSEDTSHSSI
ncbi:alpha-keto acid decarboxylase family protein [Salinisphaera sp. USBA-960]|nr:alpha-keto acid decarboxylase family protein [Salifodinibacter halophilus]NNC25797.1 alpha-keto acid decarboxylase family protein [Salifodinibacter halophilus]